MSKIIERFSEFLSIFLATFLHQVFSKDVQILFKNPQNYISKSTSETYLVQVLKKIRPSSQPLPKLWGVK